MHIQIEVIELRNNDTLKDAVTEENIEKRRGRTPEFFKALFSCCKYLKHLAEIRSGD
jgi:hypothetical protein